MVLLFSSPLEGEGGAHAPDEGAFVATSEDLVKHTPHPSAQRIISREKRKIFR
jgi:hypothetical protein